MQECYRDKTPDNGAVLIVSALNDAQYEGIIIENLVKPVVDHFPQDGTAQQRLSRKLVSPDSTLRIMPGGNSFPRIDNKSTVVGVRGCDLHQDQFLGKMSLLLDTKQIATNLGQGQIGIVIIKEILGTFWVAERVGAEVMRKYDFRKARCLALDRPPQSQVLRNLPGGGLVP